VSGTLKFSDVTVDQDTGSVTLRAVFPNPENLLLPGMYVRAVIEEGVNEKAILVPQQAVSRGPKGEAVVMLVNASGTVEPRPVMAERAIGDKWLVTGGLAAGDRVIVEGLQKARPGSPVKAVPAGASGGAVQAAGK
jgi:membrane fusion protein (multidrug efflux system)